MIANPQKGAILGIMLLVALYFWAPLVAGWLGKKPTGQTAAPADLGANALAGFPAQSVTGDKPAQPAAAETPWYLLTEWMDRDPLKRTAESPIRGRDPFRFVAQAVKPTEPPPEPKKKPIVAETFALALSGTVVGPGRRLATINGKTYREGDDVKLTSDGQSVAFKVAEVHPQSVVLSFQGKSLELKMKVLAATSQIELMGKNE